MRKTITTRTIYGRWKTIATVRKCLAINRLDDDYWGITYIPSGLRFPGWFVTKKDAIAASKVARRIFPYPIKNNEHLMPTEAQWFEVLKDNAIPFIR
jgi:hypothetical protein